MSLPADQTHVSAFRRWLVDRLKESGWVHYAGESVEQVAERLWVSPEAIAAAKAALEAEFREAGQLPWGLGGVRRHSSRRRYEIVLPKVVHRDWREYCRSREITDGTALRSLIHYVLCRPEDPTFISDRWRYRGKAYEVCLERGGKHKKGKYITTVQTEITPGSHEAMKDRAKAAMCRPSGLVRGAIIDLLEGRIKKLPVVHVQQMWDDPNRYWRRGGR